MHPVLKPLPKKHKSKHLTNPHPPFGATCFVCGRTDNLQTHEIFGGQKNRNLSIQYGLQVYLCWDHHLGTDGVHGKNGWILADRLHVVGQKIFELTGTRDKFMTIFKIGNYL